MSAHGYAVRRRAPVRLSELDAVPGFPGSAEQLIQSQALAASASESRKSRLLSQQPHEPVDPGVCLEQRPIEPVRFVVLAIGVIVADLRAPDLIAHSDHGYAQGEHRDRQEILNLPVAQSFDCRDRPIGPSTPQFQLRLSLAPSRLLSPFASLCFWL